MTEWESFFKRNRKIRYWLRVFGVSILGSIVVLGLVGGVVWANRTKVAQFFLTKAPQAPVISPMAQALSIAPVIEPAATTIPITPPTTNTVEGHKDLTIPEVVAQVNPSVVSIEVSAPQSIYDLSTGKITQGSPRKIGGGSGFFVSSDGLIVTNRHVVDYRGAQFSVTTSSGKKYTATLSGIDPTLDIAFLKTTGGRFPSATLGNSNSLELGQSVVAIGFALGEFKNSVSVGVISGLSRSIVAGGAGGQSQMLDMVIQTDAAINPGNSGGPLLNLRGEVIGVNVAVAQGSQSIGFALPINSVKQSITSVKRTGTISRPYIGVRYTPITQALQATAKLSVDYGILVSGDGVNEAVLPGSPAQKAGIVANDIILAINGTKIDSSTNFTTMISGKKVGDPVTLLVLHEGVQKTVSLTLAQAPTN